MNITEYSESWNAWYRSQPLFFYLVFGTLSIISHLCSIPPRAAFSIALTIHFTFPDMDKMRGGGVLHRTGWCQEEDDAARCTGPLHQTGALLLAGGDTGWCCAECDVIRPAGSTFMDVAESTPALRNECKCWFWETQRQEADDWTLVKSSQDRTGQDALCPHPQLTMREIVHIQAGQCGNQIGAKVSMSSFNLGEGGHFNWVLLS